MKYPRIGTHLTLEKEETLFQLIKSLDTLYKDYPIPNFQVYLGDKVGGKTRYLTSQDITNSKKILKMRGFFIHSCLTNTLSCSRKFKAYCSKRLKNELHHVYPFKVSGVVIHPGTRNLNKNLRELKETLDIIVKNIKDLYDTEKELGNLLFENSAGEGAKVPKNIEELEYLMTELKDYTNVGVCIDTCHLFAAGAYDISKKSGIDKFKKDFDERIGLDKLKLIHLNDSKDKFSSRKDRHEVLGKGEIWKSPELLGYFLKNFKEVPYVCETSDFGECITFIEKAKKYL